MKFPFPLRDCLRAETKETAEWLAVARRVLDGGYADADKSTLKSIAIGLSAIHHPDCQAALVRITGIKERS